jgi:methylenetetrahydrofolate reductase (NADPH)
MATRDRNRIALISDAMGAAALGIPAVVCMSGNHQSLGISSQAASANDLDSVQFIQALKKIVLHNLGMNGDQLKGALNLQVGATTHPFMRPLEMGIMRLKKKVIAGADFLLTQAVFNFEQFAEWMDAVRAAGLDNRTAIIASVLILDSAGKARELQRTGTYGPIPDSVIQRIENSADQAKEGIAIASEAALRLKGMPGVRGIHIICGGCEGFAAEVIHQAGLNKQGAQTFSDHIN